MLLLIPNQQRGMRLNGKEEERMEESNEEGDCKLSW
jgi:hypothetical protein